MKEPTLHDKINFRGSVQRWAHYTVLDWQKELDKKLDKPVNSNRLRNGINYNLLFKGDEIVHIQFSFPFYGRFVDMGVGKGVKIGDVGELKIARRLQGRKSVTPRRPKKWLNKKFAYNQHRLAEIMAGHYGRAISTLVVESIVKID